MTRRDWRPLLTLLATAARVAVWTIVTVAILLGAILWAAFGSRPQRND